MTVTFLNDAWYHLINIYIHSFLPTRGVILLVYTRIYHGLRRERISQNVQTRGCFLHNCRVLRRSSVLNCASMRDSEPNNAKFFVSDSH